MDIFDELYHHVSIFFLLLATKEKNCFAVRPCDPPRQFNVRVPLPGMARITRISGPLGYFGRGRGEQGVFCDFSLCNWRIFGANMHDFLTFSFVKQVGFCWFQAETVAKVTLIHAIVTAVSRHGILTLIRAILGEQLGLGIGLHAFHLGGNK